MDPKSENQINKFNPDNKKIFSIISQLNSDIILFAAEEYSKTIMHEKRESLDINNRIIKHLLSEASSKKKISVNLRKIMPHIDKVSKATHQMHWYPAKLIPHIPRLFVGNNILLNDDDVILDPFCGTGTVLLESMLSGKDSLGIELNPVSKLISKVKTTLISPEILTDSARLLFINMHKVHQNIEPPLFHNIDLWFKSNVKLDLALIKHEIDYSEFNQDIKDFFLVCFSSTIRKVSNADPRINQPVISKHMRSLGTKRKIQTFSVFKQEVQMNVQRMQNLVSAETNNAKAQVIGSDARKADLRRRVNMIVTSPPYLNAHQYFRSTRLEFHWLGMGDRVIFNSLKERSLSHEELNKSWLTDVPEISLSEVNCLANKISKVSKIRAYSVIRYFSEMQSILERMHKLLSHEGYFVLIVGNNRVCKTEIPTNKLISKIASKIGFDVMMELVDEIKSHKLMTKRNDTAHVMNSESILIMQKL